jgi:hypothetical protein
MNPAREGSEAKPRVNVLVNVPETKNNIFGYVHVLRSAIRLPEGFAFSPYEHIHRSDEVNRYWLSSLSRACPQIMEVVTTNLLLIRYINEEYEGLQLPGQRL